jgi:hypothetical protein
LEGGPPSFPRDFTGPAVLKYQSGRRSTFAYGALTLCGRRSHGVRLVISRARAEHMGSADWTYNPAAATAIPLARQRFGLIPVRSPLLGESRLISLPRGTKMFQFPRFPPYPYGFRVGCRGMTLCALPHSDIPGSAPAGGSPRLIAAYHVLHRLLAPRHPPCALACAAPAPSQARHPPDLALFYRLCTC